MYDLREGHLAVGKTRSDGKIVDEWKFVSPFREGGDAPKLSVQVSIYKVDGDRIEFRAHGAHLAEPLTDTDIERLRHKVEEALRFQHHMLTQVTWEDWLEVRVSGFRKYRDTNSRYRNDESELRIDYTWLKRGVDTRTGKAYVINSNGIAVDFPKPKKANELDEGETIQAPGEIEFRGMFKRDLEAEYSYIPATPENIAGLEDMLGRMQTLREKISDFLGQDKVLQSLADVNSQFPLLSSGK